MSLKFPIFNLGDTTYGFSLNDDETFAIGGEYSSHSIGNCLFITDDQGKDTFNFNLIRQGLTIDISLGGESFVTDLEDGPKAKLVCESAIENVIGGRAGDTIYGNDFGNVIIGGLGGDDIWGNEGADTFVYRNVRQSTVANHDTIEDFQTGLDFINLSRVDADSTKHGRQHFDFIGHKNFSHDAGELRLTASGHLLGDTDGDGHADFRIDVVGDVHKADLLGIHL